MNRHILIDGNNLLHRAFHVFVVDENGLIPRKPRFASDSGYPTGLIYGPLSMLADWMPALGRFNAVHFFNDGFPSRRRALDPSYKQKDPNRVSLRDVQNHVCTLADGFEAKGEMDVLMHVLQLLGVRVYWESDEEADDLIASFVKSHSDDVSVVVSSDKDFFQLLENPRVAVYRPGANGPRMLDAEGAEAHWATLNKGKHPPVPVQRTRMFKSLCGDASDGIIGVPRLRKRIAVDASGHANIDELAAAQWPGFSDMERQHACELLDRIKLNWQLVGLFDDLDVKPLGDAEPDFDTAGRVLNDLGIRLDMSFLVPGQERMRIADVPAKIIGDDWTSDL
jgi:5'-3' exonuclease